MGESRAGGLGMWACTSSLGPWALLWSVVVAEPHGTCVGHCCVALLCLNTTEFSEKVL